VPPIVEQSDLVVTVPVPLARYFAKVSSGIRVVRPPFEPPRIELKQIWHRKFHHDARSRWLRLETEARLSSAARRKFLVRATATILHCSIY
jgi:DNA-binding transcriptional LysR family regulator